MTEETPETTPPQKPRRWLKPLLFASLAINLLVAGVVAGSLLSPDSPRKRGDEDRAMRGVLGEPFLRALPGDQRRAMVRDIVRQRDTLREGRDAVRNRLEGFLAALRAESFDRAEAERLLADQRGAVARIRDIGEVLLLDRLEAMSPAERAAYADALEERLRGGKRR